MTPSPLARVAWLFVKGEQTIHVSFSKDGLAINANGPLQARRVFTFGDIDTAQTFLALYERSLLDAGWVLQAFVERRASRRGPVAEAGERRLAQAVH